MNAITLPIPKLSWKPTGPSAEIEQPVNIHLDPIAYSDGAPVGQNDAKKFGAFVYRVSGAAEEIWNEKDQVWQAAPGDIAALATLQPVPLTYKEGEAQPWQGLLVAIGQKDKQGTDAFVTTNGGDPRYQVRAYAQLQHNNQDFVGLSAPSPEFRFISGAENQRFTIKLDPSSSRDCESARIVLKNASLIEAGYLEIRANGGQEVEIVNCDAGGNKLASVLLAADGSIHLNPAAGQRIVLGGELRAKKIKYESYNSGTLTELV